MSVNFSQNPNYIQQPNNFGAMSMEEVAPQEQMNMLKAMELPSNRQEFTKWLPYFSTAMGASVLISKLTKMATTLNPDKNPAITVADSFNKSVIGRATGKIDNITLPVINKIMPKAQQFKTALSNITPKYVKDLAKNIYEKFSIGMSPKNCLAAGQSRGFTIGTSEDFIKSMTQLAKDNPANISKLGIGNILQDFSAKKINSKEAIEAISNHFAKSKITIQEFTKLVGDKKILTQLNLAKSFAGNNGKSKLTKILQKFVMYNAEGAGGGVAGGMVMGTILNSIFLASTIKRTCNAPWGDKFSTFMEGALCDFCGGMLVNLVIAPRLSYKLLGLKNLDKTATQIKRAKQLEAAIIASKEEHKILTEFLKNKKPEFFTKNFGVISKYLKKYNIQLSPKTSIEEIQKALTPVHAKSALIINNAIGKLGQARAFKSHGFWKDIIYRPVHFVGKIANVGLETLPVKVQGQMLVKGKLKDISKFAVCRNYIGNKLKGAAGYWRFFLVTTMIGGPLISMLAKFSHTVFGKAKKCYYGKEAEEQEALKKQTATQQQSKQQQIDKMQAYSAITKQLGELRQATQPQTQMTANYNPQMSQSLVAKAMNDQRTRLDQRQNQATNTSPATYIPNPVSYIKEDSDMTNVLNQNLLKSNRIEQYAIDELNAIKSGKNLYQ